MTLQVGICHSDYHQVMNEWGNTKYPVIPGCAVHGLQFVGLRKLVCHTCLCVTAACG